MAVGDLLFEAFADEPDRFDTALPLLETAAEVGPAALAARPIVRARIDEALRTLDLVRRDEFDAMAEMAAVAPGVRKVTSMAKRPPATSAFASATPSSGRSPSSSLTRRCGSPPATPTRTRSPSPPAATCR